MYSTSSASGASLVLMLRPPFCHKQYKLGLELREPGNKAIGAKAANLLKTLRFVEYQSECNSLSNLPHSNEYS